MCLLGAFKDAGHVPNLWTPKHGKGKHIQQLCIPKSVFILLLTIDGLRPLRSETGQTSMGDGRVDFLSYWQLGIPSRSFDGVRADLATDHDLAYRTWICHRLRLRMRSAFMNMLAVFVHLRASKQTMHHSSCLRCMDSFFRARGLWLRDVAGKVVSQNPRVVAVVGSQVSEQAQSSSEIEW